MDEYNLDEMQLKILELLNYTNTPLFITGKAGSGKTTFLKIIKEKKSQQSLVAAPTAVAALNAGGVTLHSLFQLPLGPLRLLKMGIVYEHKNYSLPLEKKNLLLSLKLLIIDEISMVRADVIDRIDFILRTVRGINLPFGGVQIVMFGDLYQLPPVIQEDWTLLDGIYESPYFFNAKVFSEINLELFELTKVFRQTDEIFLDILNAIRIGEVPKKSIDKLNDRCIPLNDIDSEGFVTLATHNHIVDRINTDNLNRLSGEIKTVEAKILGNFPRDAYPTDEILNLKIGAKVVFIKNDTSGSNLYYNGKLARIKEINKTNIVLSLEDSSELSISPIQWTNYKFILEGGSIKEQVNGTFSQYPIKLAWSVTIHKSQGLTFDKVIVDLKDAFSFGQSYVALSRCRSLDGLILKNKISEKNILVDLAVKDYMKRVSEKKDFSIILEQYKNREYFITINQMLDFSNIIYCWNVFLVEINKFANKDIAETVKLIDEKLILKIQQVSNKFRTSEYYFSLENANRVGDGGNRLKKSFEYFKEQLNETLDFINQLLYISEKNLADRTLFFKAYNNLQSTIDAKLNVLGMEFDKLFLNAYIEVYINSILNYAPIYSFNHLDWASGKISSPIYDELLLWRKKVAEHQSIPEYLVLSEKTCQLIALKLPQTYLELRKLKGVGEQKATLYGTEILEIIIQGGHQQLLF